MAGGNYGTEKSLVVCICKIKAQQKTLCFEKTVSRQGFQKSALFTEFNFQS